MSDGLAITLALLISSGIYSAAQIDKNIDKWTSRIESADILTERQWEVFRKEISVAKTYALTKAFTNNFDDYKLIKDNIYDLEDISIAWVEYTKGKVSTESASDIEYVNESDLSNYNLFEKYYNMYLEMQPSEENIQVQASLTNNNKTLKITIKNNNLLPLQSCTVKYDFRLL